MSAVTPPKTTPAGRPARRWVGGAQPQAPPPATVAHRRRLLALAALGVVLALLSAGWLALGGSGQPPPATGSARLVPAGALAYVHLSTDSSRPAVQAARRLAVRFPDYPLLYAAVLNRLAATLAGGAGTVDFDRDVRPWLGAEVALAELGTSGAGAQPLLVLDVRNRARARAFVTSAGAAPAGAYDGASLLSVPSGRELAFVGHYLVAGPDAGVRAAIDAARGRTASLAHDPVYERAVASEPADRVLDAYLPAAGVRSLLASRSGVAGAVAVMLGRPGVEGTAISVSASASGARVLVHSVFARDETVRTFNPTLQSVLPSGSSVMLDVPGLDRAAPGLLRAGAVAGIGANIGALLHRLGSALASQGVKLSGILSMFDGETAVALSPGPSPALLIVARVGDPAAARAELASLDAPLTALFSPPSSASAGQVPELAATELDGATVNEVQLGPGLQLEYGVWGNLVVVSTSVKAIEEVAARSHALAGDAGYRAVLSGPDHPAGPVSSLVFLDFSRLLQLAEQTGLTSSARTHALLPDLSKVRTVGMSSTSTTRDTTTELTLEIP
jgi:hypothetical protein